MQPIDVITLSSNKEFLRFLGLQCEQILGDRLKQLHPARNRRKALALLNQANPKLILIDDAHLRNSAEPGVAGTLFAEQMLTACRADQSGFAQTIVITTMPGDPQLAGYRNEHIHYLLQGTQFESDLTRMLEQLVPAQVVDPSAASITVVPPPKKLVITVYLYDDLNWEFRWQLWEGGKRTTPNKPTTINVAPNFRDDIKTISGWIDDAFVNDQCPLNWKDMFAKVGAKVAGALSSNEKLTVTLDTLKQSHRIQDIAWRFEVVGPECHKHALESVQDLWALPNHLFLNHPLFRGFGSLGPFPYPEDGSEHPEKVRVLLVEAPASGKSERLQIRLSSLGATPAAECAALKLLFQNRLQASFAETYPPPAQESLLLNPQMAAKAGKSMKDCFEEMWNSRSWDIVHFVGHSGVRVVDSQIDSYLVFPHPSSNQPGAPAEGSPDELNMKTIVRNMQYVRLLYLSSCESGSWRFSETLREASVGKFIGYRWKVGNSDAREFAEAFYTRYIQHKDSIPTAFQKARHRLHEEHQDSPIWASPILYVKNTERQLMSHAS